MHAQGTKRATGRTRLIVQKIKNVRSFLALPQHEDARNDHSECAQQAAEFLEFETRMSAYYEQNKVPCPPHFAVGGKVVVRLNSSLRHGNGNSHVRWYRARISQVLNAEHIKLRCKLVDYFVKRDIDASDVRVVIREFDETVCLPNVKLCLLSGVDKKLHAEFEQFVCDTLKVGEVYEAEMAHACDSRSNAFSLRVYLNCDLHIGSIGRTTRCINEYIIESAKNGAPILSAQAASSSHTATNHSETKLQTSKIRCPDAASCSSDVNSCHKRELQNSTEQKKSTEEIPVAVDDVTKLKAKTTKASGEDQGTKNQSPTRARPHGHKSKMRMTFDESDFARECLTFFEQRLPPRAFEFTELPTLHGALRDVLLNRVDCYYRQLNTLQAYVVPYLMAGHHVVAVAPRGRGKTNALALPIVNDFVKNSRYLQNTPVSVVLCSSWERVSLMRQVLNELFGMVMSTNDVSILAAYGGDGRDDEALQSDLLNGAHVLIVTPFVLARLIRAHAVDLRRTVHLFIDDADEVLARQAEYVSTVLVHFDALREERLLRSGGVQLALTARSYTNEIVEFCETRSVRFVFTFDSIAEAAIYCRLVQSVLPTFGEATTADSTCGKQSHARERDARIERKLVALVAYLKSVTKYRKRIIVFVEQRDDFTVTDRLRKALSDVHVGHMREPYEEVQLRTALDDFLLESRGTFTPLTKHHRVVPDSFARRRCCLLVLTDASLDRQLIWNALRQSADLVVHFKLEQKELFGKRLLLLHKSAFLDHFTDDSDDANEVEQTLSANRLAPLPGFVRRPAAEFNSVAKSCMLVGEEHVEQLGGLVDYWKRARVQVPADVLQAVARTDFDHTRRLCSRWLAFAECDERDRCTLRHAFVPGDFALHREFPRDATLRFRVQRVVDASCYYVQLLEAYERRGGDPIRRYRPRFEAVSFDLQLHFADARNRVAPRNLYVGLICAVRDPSRRCALARFADFDIYSEWFRVRIVRCSEQLIDRRCDALFVDVGCLRTLSQDDLFELPEFLQVAEPSALPVFAVNIKPADLHLAWTPEANRFAKQRCVGKLFVGRLTLSTDRYLWIASMRERQFYADVNRYADQPRLTTLLIENAFGVINSSV